MRTPIECNRAQSEAEDQLTLKTVLTQP